MVRDDHRRQKHAIVEKRRGRNIAAAGRHQLQQRDRRTFAAVRQRRDGVAAKPLYEMFARAVAVALVRQHRAHALMGGGVIGIGLQRRLVMRARFGMAVGAEQQVAEIDMRHRIFRMVQDRLGIDAAGGVDGALGGEPRTEFVERAEMGRMPAQDVDEGCLRLQLAIERAEQRRTLDFGRKMRAPVERQRQLRVELAQPRFLREAGRPGRLARRTGRMAWRAVWSRASKLAGFRRAHYRLIRRCKAGLKSRGLTPRPFPCRR